MSLSISISIMPSRFIHVVENNRISFILRHLNNIPLSTYTTFASFIIDGHLACFHTLAIMTNAVVDMGHRYLFKTMILFPLDIYPEVELLDHMVVLFLIS